MKVEILKHKSLDDLGRIVKPGDILETPAVPETLLNAYIANGIAKELQEKKAAPKEVNTNGR